MFVIELKLEPMPERMAARPAHREKLAALKAAGTLRMSGPFADDSGAFVILDVKTRAELDAIVAADPYFAAKGVTLLRVVEWAPVFY